jgi:hypothetical protein
VKTDSPDLSRQVVAALEVDEVVLEAATVLGAVQAASEVVVEVLAVDMEVVVVEVSVVDTVDLPLATKLVGHLYLQIRLLTTRLPVRKEAKRSTFATFVSLPFLNTCLLTSNSSHGPPAMRISSSYLRQ